VIKGIGVDIVEVYRIREALERTGGFEQKVFTAAESDYCRSKGVKAIESFAARYAAKEAFFKALGTGWRGELAWTEIEVVSDELGAPRVNTTGESSRLISEKEITNIHLSLSHTGDNAIAMVIFEG